MAEETKSTEVVVGQVSRIIEYAPPFTSTGVGGVGVPFRDCVFGNQHYSKGSIVTMPDGKLHECTGDKDGSWKAI